MTRAEAQAAWDALTPEERARFDHVTTYADLSRGLNRLITERDGEWCGMPMPLPGLALEVEPKNPHRARLDEMQAIMDESTREPTTLATATLHTDGRYAQDVIDDPTWTVINQWRGRTPSGVTGQITLLRHPDGRTAWGVISDLQRRNTHLFQAFEVMDAWNEETEMTAMLRLRTLLPARQWKAYLLAGSFLERAPRSDLTYLFRRGRPTLALSFHAPDAELRILAGLCLHPIGYYAGSFHGAMTPTDDVIAHLLLMRGDEPLFWRRANQHPPTVPECGL